MKNQLPVDFKCYRTQEPEHQKPDVWPISKERAVCPRKSKFDVYEITLRRWTDFWFLETAVSLSEYGYVYLHKYIKLCKLSFENGLCKEAFVKNTPK